MKYGFSLILNEYLNPSDVEYADSEFFQIVCPECFEPVFKVTRNEKMNIDYFSHYKRDKAIETTCSLRVDALNESDLKNKSNEFRGQLLDSFLNVFKLELIRNNFSGNLEKPMQVITELNNKEGFAVYKNIIADIMRNMSKNKNEIYSFFNDYIKDIEDTSGVKFPTSFSINKQKEYAYTLLTHLCSVKVKDNLGFLISFSIMFLSERIAKSINQGVVGKWQIDMLNYIKQLCNCQTIDSIKNVANDLFTYRLDPPVTLEMNSNMGNKIAAETSHEAFGALIRYPYFDILKNKFK